MRVHWRTRLLPGLGRDYASADGRFTIEVRQVGGHRHRLRRRLYDGGAGRGEYATVAAAKYAAQLIADGVPATRAAAATRPRCPQTIMRELVRAYRAGNGASVVGLIEEAERFIEEEKRRAS